MLETSAKLLAILFGLLLLAQARYIKRAVGTYIFPAALMSLAWGLYTLVPLVVLFDVPVNPVSVLYIVACVSAFSLGALPFDWQQAFESNALKTPEDLEKFDSRLMHVLFYVCAASSVVVSTISMVSQGFELSSLVLSLLETSGQYAALRGKGELEYDALGVLSIFFTYATPILGGLVTGKHRKGLKRWAFLFVAFAPSVYFMLTQSTKLILFFSIGFYFAAVLLRKIYSNELDLVDRSSVWRSFGYALLLLPLISVSFLSREGAFGVSGAGAILGVLLFFINSYAFGQVYAFSDFFSSYSGARSEMTYVHDFHSYGYYTFKSIRDLLGGDKYFPPGTFEDGYSRGEVVATNIYTIFRGLIYDFGGVGTVVFMLAAGLVVHAFFHRLLVHRRSRVAYGAFIITVVFIQGTYLFSIFMARYMYLLLVALVVALWINDRYPKSPEPVDARVGEGA